jgi:hypothetical protein
MERSDILAAMGELKLYGMRSAYDGVLATAVKRQHEPQQVVGDLLKAEIDEKQARSIKYQMTIAKLPLAKDLEDFDFDAADVNETLVRDLAGGGFIEQQRNVVLIGGTGTGKSHAAIAIARACIRRGARGVRRAVLPLEGPLLPPHSSTSSTSSTSWTPKRAPAARAASPTTCAVWTSWCWTSSAICPSPSRAASCSSTLSASSTSAPRSSSPPTSPSANGPASSATPR